MIDDDIPDFTQINVKISPNQYKKLKDLAKKKGLKKYQMFWEAISQYYRRQTKEGLDG